MSMKIEVIMTDGSHRQMFEYTGNAAIAIHEAALEAERTDEQYQIGDEEGRTSPSFGWYVADITNWLGRLADGETDNPIPDAAGV
jgi:hypothetical protein